MRSQKNEKLLSSDFMNFIRCQISSPASISKQPSCGSLEEEIGQLNLTEIKNEVRVVEAAVFEWVQLQTEEN